MQFIGVEERAKQVRAALNRLHWEIQHAVGVGQTGAISPMELAEAAAIMANVMRLVAENVPDEQDALTAALGSDRERFVRHLEFFLDYYKIPR